MEIYRYQSIESPPMPPRTDREYGDTSFTGLPSSLIQSARDLAKQQKVYPRDVFTEAILALIARLDTGETPDWLVSRPRVGTTPYHTRLEVDVLEEMRKACELHHIRKSTFFMTAMVDHLRKHGIEVEV
jgi:hypothetical protein